MKTGRLSREEQEYIRKNADNLPLKTIAANLNRSEEAVSKQLLKLGKTGSKKAVIAQKAEHDIKATPYWKQIKKQFSEDEQEDFLFNWTRIIAQFNNDITPTEEIQAMDFIKYELLANRALITQREGQQQIKEIEEELRVEELRDIDQRDQVLVHELRRQIASLQSAREALSREFRDYQEKKSKVQKDMKGTRDQRLAKIEKNTDTFDGLIMKLTRDPEFHEEEGKQMERMREAMVNVKQELGGYHTYEDGTVDRPFLNSETVFFEDEEKDSGKSNI